MFEPNEESVVLDIVSGFLDIPGDEMMRIGDTIKEMLFGPEVVDEKVAAQRLKAGLKDMSKEHALIAGMFISGLVRCNLAQSRLSHCQQEEAEGEGQP